MDIVVTLRCDLEREQRGEEKKRRVCLKWSNSKPFLKATRTQWNLQKTNMKVFGTDT